MTKLRATLIAVSLMAVLCVDASAQGVRSKDGYHKPPPPELILPIVPYNPPPPVVPGIPPPTIPTQGSSTPCTPTGGTASPPPTSSKPYDPFNPPGTGYTPPTYTPPSYYSPPTYYTPPSYSSSTYSPEVVATQPVVGARPGAGRNRSMLAPIIPIGPRTTLAQSAPVTAAAAGNPWGNPTPAVPTPTSSPATPCTNEPPVIVASGPGFGTPTQPPRTVPEPSTLWLLLAGLGAGALALSRRRNARGA